MSKYSVILCLILGCWLALMAAKVFMARKANGKIFDNGTRNFSSTEIKLNESIFFVETNEEMLELRPRSLCSLESAAKNNPNREVFMLMSSKSLFTQFPDYMKKYTNVKFRFLDLDEFTKGTHVESIWFSGLVRASLFYLSHCSDMLRFLLMYKFGGFYFDQDVISTGPVPASPRSFVMSAGNFQYIATAVIKMERGHPLMNEVLRRMSWSFDGTNWVTNGPLLLTDTAETFCSHQWIKWSDSDKFANYQCPGFEILPPENGCPIPAGEYRLYYDPAKLPEVEARLSKGFVFHYFNKMRTKNLAAGEDEEFVMARDQPLYRMMERHCPETERQLLRPRLGQHY